MIRNSKRLTFRKFVEGDFEDYLSVVCNEEVMITITGKALTETEARVKFEKLIRVGEEHPETGYFSVSLKPGETFIGYCKVVMTGAHEAEIGYALLPGYWGRGYGGEISGNLVEHCRELPFIHSLVAYIDPSNAASGKILLKSGFSLQSSGTMDGLPAETYFLKLNQ